MNKAFKKKRMSYMGAKIYVDNVLFVNVGDSVSIQGTHYTVEKVLTKQLITILPNI